MLFEQPDDPRLLLLLPALRRGQVVERDAVGLDLGPQVVVVGDHQGDLGVEFPLLVPPEQVDQAVAVLRHEDRQPLGAVGEGRPVIHAVLPGERGEGGVEVAPAQAEAPALDLDPQEEPAALGVTDELVGAQDVPVVQGDEARDRSDEPPVVGAVDQEADIVAHGGPSVRMQDVDPVRRPSIPMPAFVVS